MPHGMIVRSFVAALLILSVQFLRASPQAAPEAQSPPIQSTGRLTPGGEVRIPSKHSGVPAKGDFQSTTQESAEDREHRQIREAHFATRTSDKRIFPEIKDPGKLVDGQAETTGMMIYDSADGISTLPARTSAAVVIGTVMTAKAFLSQDHTYVYSDFSIKIDEILKPDVAAHLSVGEQLVAYREGGTIRFPSGHARNFLNYGQGYPVVGAQYLFFLGGPDTNIREYQMTLFATYQLVNGAVFPLDDANATYEGKSETALLDQVRKLIAASKNGDLQ